MAGLNQTRDPLVAAFLERRLRAGPEQLGSAVRKERHRRAADRLDHQADDRPVVVEAQQNLDEVLTVTDADVDRTSSPARACPSAPRMTRGNLLHIALMSSENRAAAALGRNYPGGINAFVEAMNAKARELGMNDTHYVDSSGLSSQNVSSARDLAKLVVTAHQEPLLRQYSTDPNYVVEASGRRMRYHNTNYLVAHAGLEHRPAEDRLHQRSRALPGDAGHDPGPQRDHGVPGFEGQQSRTADAGRMRRWLEALKPAADSGGGCRRGCRSDGVGGGAGDAQFKRGVSPKRR
jgi:D-alanyl-D-alanine endopeptidase (penicillin-binding protein 7)